MKRLLIISLSMIIFGMGTFGCGEGNKEPATSQSGGSPNEIDAVITGGNEEEDAVDTANREMIAKALGIEESSNDITSVISGLRTIGAGQILSAESVGENGKKILNIVAEDETNYCIYLDNFGGIDRIKNMDTGE